MRGTSGKRSVAFFALWVLTLGCSGQVVHQTGRPDVSDGGAGGKANAGDGGAGGRAGAPGDAGTGNGGGGNTGAGAATACLDLSNLQTAPVVSFERDVMPIFALSCISSACHDMNAMKAGLVLGDPSTFPPGTSSCYDANDKWKCRLASPVPSNVLNAVYAGLVDVPSRTVPVVKLVTAGDPGASFLLDTVTGTQNSSWYSDQCVNLDPSKSNLKCGADMPLGTVNWCEDGDVLSVERARALAAWISQGAQMN